MTVLQSILHTVGQTQVHFELCYNTFYELRV